MASVPSVAGLDGCRGGWVLVSAPARPRSTAREAQIRVISSFREVVELLGDGALAAVAVDIPIGLGEAGARSCDIEARARLGPRRSSVFPAPVRAVLGAQSWHDAVGRSRRAHGKAVTRQTWNLVPKIAEVDRWITPALSCSVLESHPEVSFAVLSGEPMRHAKRTPEGRYERVDALAPVFPGVAEAISADRRVRGAAADDVLDAHVLAWTAARWHHDEAIVLGDGRVDHRELPMRIVA